MHVCITGGTGFVGSHSVAAILRAGHTVRLMVRNPAKVATTFAPLAIDPDTDPRVEIVTGDLTDDDAIRRALEGCDAVLHAASVYSLDPADADEMSRVNLAGQRSVLLHAEALGLDPIIHVSSVVALLRGDGVQELSDRSPVGTSTYPYSGSKAAQEALAREFQDRGVPVVITNPGGVYGPDDPYTGESTLLFQQILAGRLTAAPSGAVAVVDVRDLAEVHAAALEPGLGPRRFMCGGAGVSFRDMVATVSGFAGVHRPTVQVPGSILRQVGAFSELLAERFERRMLVSSEAAWLSSLVMRPDNASTTARLGVNFRPAVDTLRDQYDWQVRAGRL